MTKYSDRDQGVHVNPAVGKGRYIGIPRHDRICKVCKTGSIENEQHFLLECPAYKLLQEKFILKLEKEGINVPSHTCSIFV